jgi:hypothetical protein
MRHLQVDSWHFFLALDRFPSLSRRGGAAYKNQVRACAMDGSRLALHNMRAVGLGAMVKTWEVYLMR